MTYAFVRLVTHKSSTKIAVESLNACSQKIKECSTECSQKTKHCSTESSEKIENCLVI